jgi:hypothetical protein
VIPTSLSLDAAVEIARTGDVWLFRGSSVADRAIRVTTNSPVNHVGMAVVLDDLPPLMWHAELGRSLPDVWSGKHSRGVQLHDLRDAVTVWATRYGQRAWLRQLVPEATREMEDAVLRTIARMDGTPFPTTAALAQRWVRGRAGRSASLETVYCAEVVAATYTAMGLLPGDRPVNWYDPGRFWSGDRLRLEGGATLGTEIEVSMPPAASVADDPDDHGTEASPSLPRRAGLARLGFASTGAGRESAEWTRQRVAAARRLLRRDDRSAAPRDPAA